MKFPNKLKHWREIRKLSQPDLAKALCDAGYPTANKQLIWKIENGERKMTPQEAMTLADILDCTINDLIDTPNEKPDNSIDVGEFIFKKTEARMTSIEEAALFIGHFYSAFRKLPDPVRREVREQLSRGLLEETKIDGLRGERENAPTDISSGKKPSHKRNK